MVRPSLVVNETMNECPSDSESSDKLMISSHPYPEIVRLRTVVKEPSRSLSKPLIALVCLIPHVEEETPLETHPRA